MVYVVGLDVGGANLKAVKLLVDHGRVEVVSVVREYLPLWVVGREGLERGLRELRRRLVAGGTPYAVSACMTAELCDVYRVKREGVEHVVSAVCEAFSDSTDTRFVTVDKRLVGRDEAVRDPLRVAAANWAASAWLLERLCAEKGLRGLLLVDIGSTTTTIIPVVEGRALVEGLTDPDKLCCGELVYTGVLRGSVATVVDRVPYKGRMARVSSERFALMGDVHLVLGNIKEEDYTTETADGRGVSVREAVERLARVVCADAEMMSRLEVRELARYVYEAQVFKVFEALMQVRSRLASAGVDPGELTVVTAGVGGFLARTAAERAGFTRIVSVEDLVGSRVAGVLPAYAAALMMAVEVLRAEEASG